jgi:hypothetical protein
MINKTTFYRALKYFLYTFSVIVLFASCRKLYNLPDDLPYLSDNVNYPTPVFKAVLGRTTLGTPFVKDDSTFPLTFEIIDVKNLDKSSSNALSVKKPVKVWTAQYTGNETSLAEIESKRKVEEHSIFEVRSSGEFVLWSSATNADLLKSAPDSLYTFKVRVSNKAGEKIIGPLTFIPVRERPYEPSYHIDPTTGVALKEIDNTVKRILPETLTGMRGSTTNRPLVRQTNPTTTTVRQDVWVYFNRVGDGNSLTFKFMDKDSIAIDPKKFNGTDWKNVVHGFNPKFESTYVRYDVAYPIPLTMWPTKYTTPDGSQALSTFQYNRIGFGGNREIGIMSLRYNIFREGDWEIIFYFHNETPKFEDE